MTIAATELTRFSTDLDRLCPPGWRLGVAVSGGPDSLALLLLTSTARPDRVEAATVDHRLRPESSAEATEVGRVCAGLEVAHAILSVAVPAGASVQARARQARYEALAGWARRRRLDAVLTAHHLDDQAETLLMRLARGAGLGGLAGVREVRELAPGTRLVRPLLRWRKHELIDLVAAAGLTPVEDPANRDPRHDRTQVRAVLQGTPALDPPALAASAAWLGEVDGALRWTVDWLARDRLRSDGDRLLLSAADLPLELQRRLLLSAIASLGGSTPRGPDLQRAIGKLAAGQRCSLSGVVLTGGEPWTLRREVRASRRPPAAPAGRAPGKR